MPRITKRTTPQALIRRMVQRLVDKFHPEQVILFGSHARGDAGPDSDVDRLIVMMQHDPARMLAAGPFPGVEPQAVFERRAHSTAQPRS